jgi:hypothetical protein
MLPPTSDNVYVTSKKVVEREEEEEERDVDSLVTRNPKGTRKTTESLLTTHHSTLQ